MSKIKKRTSIPSRGKTERSRTTRRTFDLARDSIFVADPVEELRICGGRGVLSEEESGPLDTDPGPDVPVSDQRRLERALLPQLLVSVDQVGVIEPIVIARIDDVPTVVAGKSRVRAARASNRVRKTDGRPLIKVRCVVKRDTSRVAVLATMIAENNLRTEDDLGDRIEKLRAFLECGGVETDAATHFGVKAQTIRGWLEYDDHATADLKRAVRDGRVGASTAAELARVRDADAQRAALGKVLAAPGVKQRSARATRALVRGQTQPDRATDRRSQVMLLDYLRDMATHGEDNDEAEYWRGVQDALRLVTGRESGAVDGILLGALADARGGGDPSDQE